MMVIDFRALRCISLCSSFTCDGNGPVNACRPCARNVHAPLTRTSTEDALLINQVFDSSVFFPAA